VALSSMSQILDMSVGAALDVGALLGPPLPAGVGAGLVDGTAEAVGLALPPVSVGAGVGDTGPWQATSARARKNGRPADAQCANPRWACLVAIGSPNTSRLEKGRV